MTESPPSVASDRPEHTVDVVVLGAGPIGLDAALALTDAGRDFLLLEAGPRVAAGVRGWEAVELFSPWDIDLSSRMRAALGSRADDLDPAACPTGEELCDRALDPIARLPSIEARLRLAHRVVAVGREGLLKPNEIGTPARAARRFRLLVDTPHGERVLYARTVLDCTGAGHRPNWLGASGIPAPGERDLVNAPTPASGLPRLVRTLASFLDVPAATWRDRTVLLVGSGHSAQTAAVQLAEAGAQVCWALRSEGADIAPMADDPLPQRAALHAQARALLDGERDRVEAFTGVEVHQLQRDGDRVRATLRRRSPAGPSGPSGSEATTRVEVDGVVALVGSRGDQALYRELQVQECYATAGPMRLAAALLGEADPDNAADCMTQTGQGPETLVTPEPGYFILGSKSYGNNSAFLLRVGYQQVDDVLTLI